LLQEYIRHALKEATQQEEGQSGDSNTWSVRKSRTISLRSNANGVERPERDSNEETLRPLIINKYTTRA